MIYSILHRHNALPTILMTTLILFMFVSCSHRQELVEDGPYWVDDDKQTIPEPKYRDPNIIWTSLDRTIFDQIDEGFDIQRNIRKVSGSPRQSENINSFDEVPNSSWFTNRHGFSPMTPEEIARGPQYTPGPDTSGPWLVFRPKIQGATAGFWIEDSRGDQYIIKFDPPENPKMATAAAAMGSRYFHACGYNVPQETIVYYNPDILQIKKSVTYKDAKGIRHLFTEEILQEILSQIPYQPDGTIRSLASLSLGKQGKIKGPFSYKGRRNDDPNDWYEHEHRRELRGLSVIASLINHYDAKDQNTLDVFVEENSNLFLKHFLIDFGSTFGSDGKNAKEPIKGYANMIDPRDAFVSLITLGLKTWGWEYAKPYKYPAIGYFESEIFEAQKFDPIYPNPAFENMTNRDAYWGAKIVMAFRDDDLEALVKVGQFSNPESEKYLLRTLIERRDKIGRYYFGKVNPLDNFETGYTDDGFRIGFEDLAIKYGLETEDAVYRYTVEYNGKNLFGQREAVYQNITLNSSDLLDMMMAFNKEDHLYKVDISTKRNNTGLSKPTRLWLWFMEDKSMFKLVGVEHID